MTALQAELVGRAAVCLGAGRAKLDDVVDPGVGIEVLAPVGTAVQKGAPVLRAHHRAGRGLDDARVLLEQAIQIGADRPERMPLIVERIA